MAQLCGLTITEIAFELRFAGPSEASIRLRRFFPFRYRESFAGESFAACVNARTSISLLSVSVQNWRKVASPFPLHLMTRYRMLFSS